MKLACVSDIHGKFGFKWPKADVLIIAGDIFPTYSRNNRTDAFIQSMYVNDTFAPAMFDLLDKGAYDHIIVVPGNHDRVFLSSEFNVREKLDSISDSFHLLIDQEAMIDGKVFYGSPWTPWFFGEHWVYNLPKDNSEAARLHWDRIPDDTEVLITHGPPHEILDKTSSGQLAGCKSLKKKVASLENLKLHVFGHIHEGYGQKKWCSKPLSEPQKLFVNASICTLAYNPINAIQVVEI